MIAEGTHRKKGMLVEGCAGTPKLLTWPIADNFPPSQLAMSQLLNFELLSVLARPPPLPEASNDPMCLEVVSYASSCEVISTTRGWDPMTLESEPFQARPSTPVLATMVVETPISFDVIPSGSADGRVDCHTGPRSQVPSVPPSIIASTTNTGANTWSTPTTAPTLKAVTFAMHIDVPPLSIQQESLDQTGLPPEESRQFITMTRGLSTGAMQMGVIPTNPSSFTTKVSKELPISVVSTP
jgi:hypothetical protein